MIGKQPQKIILICIPRPLKTAHRLSRTVINLFVKRNKTYKKYCCPEAIAYFSHTTEIREPVKWSGGRDERKRNEREDYL